ncbi:MAG: DNA-deoxyinosine glycosylase [Rudaea sp.]|nr:DNA-deoxyinosine glycosylase [Rudaea sp.]
MKHGLAPILWPDSRVLVLGSLPGDESLRLQQYYANPRNQFWTILARIHDATVDADYASRLSFLRDHGIALWDVIQRADRPGSLDAAIKNAVPNDFAPLFERAPAVRTIVFNGGAAARLFERSVRRLVVPQLLCAHRLIPLPSTSPIPGRNVCTLGQKIEKWKIIAHC